MDDFESVSEAEVKLNHLNEKLSELEAQREENTISIAQAAQQIHITMKSTSAEVYQLKGQSKHQISITRTNSLCIQGSLKPFKIFELFVYF